MESALYWMWLADALGSACAQADLLLTLYPDPRRFYEYIVDGGILPSCLSARALERLRTTRPMDYESRLEQCERAGVAILTPEDPDYPERLRALPDLPLVLYATGNTACLNGRRYVGMVGTRRPTAYGAQACHDLSLELARRGLVIVSGLADGLDGQGHRAAVEAGAETVAFLGTPIDKTYPAGNVRLRRQIETEVGGAVLSEYPPGYEGKAKGTFLARNRLIAGLSEALCVAEARRKSGTMNTVAHAHRYGRPVLAVPGSIYSPVSQGTNALIRDGEACVLCEAEDVLVALGMQEEPNEEQAMPEFDTTQISMEAAAVHAALGPVPATVDALCEATGMPAHKVLAALTELELFGGATAHPGKRYSSC